MAFDGRDYHRQWKEAISELQYTRDAEEIDGALRHIEGKQFVAFSFTSQFLLQASLSAFLSG